MEEVQAIPGDKRVATRRDRSMPDLRKEFEGLVEKEKWNVEYYTNELEKAKLKVEVFQAALSALEKKT